MAGEDNSNVVLKAKIEWYREILLLEPNSKIFLPFARHLAEVGASENNSDMLNEAFNVLRRGLFVYPDFMEARLFLIELLSACGCRSQCGAEVARLASLFLSYPDFWDAWREHAIVENESSDFTTALGFMSAILKDKSLSIVQILEAGLTSLRSPSSSKITCDVTLNDSNVFVDSPINYPVSNISQEQMEQVSSLISKNSHGEPIDSVKKVDAKMSTAMVTAAASIPESAPLFAPAPPLFAPVTPAMPATTMPIRSAVSMPEPEIYHETHDHLPRSHVENYVSYAQKHEADSRSTKETLAALLADTSITVEPMEKSPFRTRSMAEVLSAQGDFKGASEIYRELISKASENEIPSLTSRLAELEGQVDGTKNSQGDVSRLVAIDDLVDTSFGILGQEEKEMKEGTKKGQDEAKKYVSMSENEAPKGNLDDTLGEDFDVVLSGDLVDTLGEDFDVVLSGDLGDTLGEDFGETSMPREQSASHELESSPEKDGLIKHDSMDKDPAADSAIGGVLADGAVDLLNKLAMRLEAKAS